MPTSPQALKLTKLSREDGILLEWTAPEHDGGSPITSYTISIEQSSTLIFSSTPSVPKVERIVVSSDVTSHKLEPLKLMTAYTANVIASNNKGDSPECAAPVQMVNGEILLVASMPAHGGCIDYSPTGAAYGPTACAAMTIAKQCVAAGGIGLDDPRLSAAGFVLQGGVVRLSSMPTSAGDARSALMPLLGSEGRYSYDHAIQGSSILHLLGPGDPASLATLLDTSAGGAGIGPHIASCLAVRDGLGRTPIIVAAQCLNLKCLALLLDAVEAHVNDAMEAAAVVWSQDLHGNTAAHHLVTIDLESTKDSGQHDEVIALLTRLGSLSCVIFLFCLYVTYCA